MSSLQTEVILRHAGAELARVTLPHGEYIIGRDPAAGIRADTPLLSRKHALLTVREDALLIEDLGSSNGTFIEQQPVAGTALVFPGQDLRLGDVTLEIVRAESTTGPTMNMAWALANATPQLPAELCGDRKYEIGAEVARGGMGAIREAQQSGMDRRVAMKVMLEGAEEADVARFVNEAKITGRLEHPNIVPVHELDVDPQGKVFYTMKFVRGITLKKVLELLAEGVEATVKKYPLPALLTIFQKACDAIAFAHSKGVIHRDLKPENIMLGDFGEVLVMDWGLAKMLGKHSTSNVQHPTSNAPARSIITGRTGESSLGSTMTGTVMGTPQYMAPEQARGEVETMDHRADIYALGAILYHLLALRPSVSGDDAWTIVTKVARGEIEPLVSSSSSSLSSSSSSRPGEGMKTKTTTKTKKGRAIPDSLAAVVRKAMAFDRAQRYARVEDIQTDIAAYQNGFATSAEKAGALRQFVLMLKRHKATSLGIAAVLLVGATLGTKAVVEGRRAASALADLKSNAPAMLELAESEAVNQHHQSALEKTEAALRLDPSLRPAYWRRAWGLIALGRFPEAATALRTASQRDPTKAKQLGAILPQIERIAAIPNEAERYAPDLLTPVFEFLQTHDASGEAGGLIKHLQLSGKQRLTIGQDRLKSLTGSPSGLALLPSGLLELRLAHTKLNSLEQVRGIPFDILIADDAKIESLEPLRGLHLSKLSLNQNSINGLAPLRGMALVELDVGMNRNPALNDLAPLTGMPLRKLRLLYCPGFSDASPLRGMPLEVLDLGGTSVSDIRPLAGMPLRDLGLGGTAVTDLRPLAGMPLENLALSSMGSLTDLSPLAGLPLRTLNIRVSPKIKDLTPLLRIPTLERLETDAPRDVLGPLRKHPKLGLINYRSQGYRPAAEVWAELDAK